MGKNRRLILQKVKANPNRTNQALTENELPAGAKFLGPRRRRMLRQLLRQATVLSSQQGQRANKPGKAVAKATPAHPMQKRLQQMRNRRQQLLQTAAKLMPRIQRLKRRLGQKA